MKRIAPLIIGVMAVSTGALAQGRAGGVPGATTQSTGLPRQPQAGWRVVPGQ